MDLVTFAEALYNLMGMNEKQKDFFNSYVLDDNAFMVCDEGDKQLILMNNFTITITENNK